MHSIHIKLTDKGHVWRCTCGASGNAHEEHQIAFNFGTQHQWIEAEQ